jgi:hypothetical protein
MSLPLSQAELDELVIYSRRYLSLEPQPQIDEDDLYHNLPLCITDAVFSINAKYQSTLQVTKRLASYAQYPYLLNEGGEEPTIENFLLYFDTLGAERMAQEVFQNRQRTSTSNGILKAEAVERFARALYRNGVNQRQDVSTSDHHAIKEAIIEIPGQRSGISLRYFYMLLGDYSYVKPDRHIMNFVMAAIGRNLDVATCHDAIVATCERLKPEFSHLNPRTLDARIWTYQRTVK